MVAIGSKCCGVAAMQYSYMGRGHVKTLKIIYVNVGSSSHEVVLLGFQVLGIFFFR